MTRDSGLGARGSLEASSKLLGHSHQSTTTTFYVQPDQVIDPLTAELIEASFAQISIGDDALRALP